LFHYARLIEATPAQPNTTTEVNRYARAEQTRIKRVDYAAQEAQERLQWRQEADALARHWQRHEDRREEIRHVREGLRAEAQARDAGAPVRRIALYKQLAAVMGYDRR
jgi:hypothetical protein